MIYFLIALIAALIFLIVH